MGDKKGQEAFFGGSARGLWLGGIESKEVKPRVDIAKARRTTKFTPPSEYAPDTSLTAFDLSSRHSLTVYTPPASLAQGGLGMVVPPRWMSKTTVLWA